MGGWSWAYEVEAVEAEIAELEAEAEGLRDTRDQQIRFLASQGWSTRDISGVAGVNHAMVARILKAV